MRYANDNRCDGLNEVIASFKGGADRIIVYVLSSGDGDPLDPSNCRYIGLTCQGLRARLSGHIAESSTKHPDGSFKSETHRARWIRSVISNEGRDALRITPVITGLSCDRGATGAGAAEKALIIAYRAAGARLTNSTVGGEGVPASGGEKRVTKNEYMRTYLANRRANDPEYAAKQREANRKSMATRYANDNEFREQALQKSREYGADYRLRKRMEREAA